MRGGAVAIIGFAGRFPGADAPDRLAALVGQRRRQIGPLPPARRALLGTMPAPVALAGWLDGIELFDPASFQVSLRDAVHQDPQHRLMQLAARRALLDAALPAEATAGRQVGVFMGQHANGYARLLQVTDEARPQAALGNVGAMLPARLSFAFDWHGPSEAVAAGAATALTAIHRAARALAAGECAMALAGAVTLLLAPPEPGGAGAPGEGLGLVLLKPLPAALRDGDPIRALIRATAVGHAGRGDGEAGLLAALAQDAGLAAPLPPAEDAAAIEAVLGHLGPAEGMAQLALALARLAEARAPILLRSQGIGGSRAALLLEPAPAALAGRRPPLPAAPLRLVRCWAGPKEKEEPVPEAAAPVPPPAPAGVAVIGIACRFPGAPDKDAFWRLLVEGRSGIAPVPAERWPATAATARLETEAQRRAVGFAGLVADVDRFDPLFFNLSPRDAELMDPQQRLFLEEAWHAFEDAGQGRDRLQGSRTAVFIGAGQGDYSRLLPTDPGRLTGQFLLGNTTSILASRISYLLDLKGPSLALDTACSSALVATDLACRAILDGSADMALAGGINLMLSPQMLVMTALSGMLAPDGRCKTFDDAADGFVAAEGIGLVVLKRLDRAQADGDRIYGVIRGSGTNQDGKSSGITAPNALAQEALLAEVWQRHAIDPARLGLIEAHGTGTALGDPIEVSALARAFARHGRQQEGCALGSVKTNIGHALAAAGAAGLIKLLLALHHRTIPPSLHFERPNRHIDLAATPFRIPVVAEPWRERLLGAVSSFGFSGTNAHLVVEAAAPLPVPAATAAGPWPLLLSGRDRAGLLRQAEALMAWLAADGATAALADIAHTLGRRRIHHEWRAVLTVADRAEAILALTALVQGRAHPVLEGPRRGRQPAAEDASWLDGGAVPAELEAARFIDLPLTAFARQRCWFEQAAGEPAPAPLRLVAEDAVMANHRVQGRPMLPGMAALALLRQAAVAQGFAGALVDVAWLRPVLAPVTLGVEVEPAGDEALLRLVDGEGLLLARARAERRAVPATTPPAFTFQGQEVAPAAVMGFLRAAGIEHGAGFALLEQVAVEPGAARIRARIRAGEALASAPLPAGELSPAALDAALQALAAPALLTDGGDAATFLPEGIVRCLCHAPMTGPLEARIALRPQATGALRLVADLWLLAPDGSPVVTLEGFSAARLPAVATDGRLVHLRPGWRATPPPSSPPAARPLVLASPAARGWAEALAAEAGGAAADLADPPRSLASTILVAVWEEEPSAALELDPVRLAAAEREGVRPLLALLRRLAHEGGARRLLLVTRSLAALPEGPIHPAHGALPGLLLTAGREIQGLEVAHVDLPAVEEADEVRRHRTWLLAEPGAGEVLAYRAGLRLRRGLEEIVPAPVVAEPVPAEGAVCLMLGGAGGLGRALSLDLARRHGARIAWVGRRQVDAALEAAMAEVRAAGGEVAYHACDIADPAALSAVVLDVRRRWGPIELALHSALVLADRSLAQMSAAELEAALGPKCRGMLALARALADQPPALLAVFSSANAFTLNPGQANYAAGSSFIDGFTLALARASGWRVKVVNWGIWGETGIVAQESFKARARREGIQPLATAEGLDAFRSLVAAPVAQAMVLKLVAEREAQFRAGGLATLEPAPVLAPLDGRAAADALAQAAAGLDVRELTAAAAGMQALLDHGRLGLARLYREEFGLDRSATAETALAAGIRPERLDLFQAHRDIVGRAPATEADATLPPGPLALLDAALAGTAELLRGRRQGAEILFPGGSTRLVDAVYGSDPAVEPFNALVGHAVAALAAARPLRILEIGAGTGATTRRVLAMVPAGRISSYHVTDLSPHLVAETERSLGSHPACRFHVLDITRPPPADLAGFDLVIAANVLHATPEIRTTLAHAKRLLGRGGMLLLNEATAASDFATLTFGLTDGWWAARDRHLRLASSPLLSVEGWRMQLGLTGFELLAVGGLGAGSGQHVLLAESDGWVERPVAAAPAPLPAAVVAGPSVAAAVGDRLDLVRRTLAEALKLDPAELDPEAPLERYGVDSLLAGDLHARLEEACGRLPRTIVFEAVTMAELAAKLPQPAAAPAPAPVRAPAPVLPSRVRDGIAIIGVAGRYPGADSIEAFWNLLAEGRSAIGPVPADRAAFRSLPAEAKMLAQGGFLDDVQGFDPLLFGISPAEAPAMDPQERLFLETVWATFEHAGRRPAAYGGDVGVFVGVMAADYQRLAAEDAARGGKGQGASPFWSIANRVSHVLDLTGPSLAVDSACSASLTALHLAAQSLVRGECSAAIAGGVHLILHPASRQGLLALGMHSASGEAKAFTADGDGLVGGEGVGAVLLRRLDDAIAAGDRIWAVLRTSAIAANGHGRAFMAPHAGRQAAALRRSLATAGIDPATLHYVETQATGAPLADLSEVTGLAEVLEGAGAPLPIGSLKPAIGHLEAASGMAQLTKLLGMLARRQLMPTRIEGPLQPEIEALLEGRLDICRRAAPWPAPSDGGPRRALVESFGAGGATAFAVLEEWREGAQEPAASPGPWLVPLSARTESALRAMAARLRVHLGASEATLPAIAWTLQAGRALLDQRLVLIAAGLDELRAALDDFLADRPGAWRQGARRPGGSTGAAPGTDPAALAAFWAAGGALDWRGLWQGPMPRPVALPSYPFEHRRYWLETVAATAPRPLPPPVTSRHAVVLEGPGDIGDLALRQLPLPPPMADEVQIRVRAFALNFADLLCLRGLYPNLERYPYLPGFEVAGEVTALGERVQGFAIGDAVVALTAGRGGQADHVNVAATAVAAKPGNLDWAEAAAAPIGYLTMRTALDRAALAAGETILIQSAAGGTGPFAVQLAVRAGARVIATAGSAEKLDFLRRLGAADVLDYRAQDVVAEVRKLTDGRGVDVVLNNLGGAAIQQGLDLLAPGGRHVEIALAGLQTAGRLDLSRLIDNQSLITLNLGRILADPPAARRAFAKMQADLEAGTVRPVLAAVLPVEHLADGYRLLAERQNQGKVVVALEGPIRPVPSMPARPAALPPPVPRHALNGGLVGRLKAIAAEILDLDPAELDPARPLPELGLNSVSGLAIMRRVHEQLGIAAPATALWQHPSLEALAAHLKGLAGPGAGHDPGHAEGSADPLLRARHGPHEPLVPIATGGDRRPSFWVHGAPGEVSWVVALGTALGADFPLYGLEAEGLAGGEVAEQSVGRMAAAYVRAIRRVVPHGPYWLGGYSGGGVIAYEMARQLQLQGQGVDRLVLLDAYAPGNPALAGMEAAYGAGFVFQLAVNWLGAGWGLARPLTASALDGLDRAAALHAALDHLYREAAPPVERDRLLALLDGMDRTGRRIGRALAGYRPRPLARPIANRLMVRCSLNMSPAGNPLELPAFVTTADYRRGWEDLLGPLGEAVLDCDHFGLLLEPARSALGRALRRFDADATTAATGHRPAATEPLETSLT